MRNNFIDFYLHKILICKNNLRQHYFDFLNRNHMINNLQYLYMFYMDIHILSTIYQKDIILKQFYHNQIQFYILLNLNMLNKVIHIFYILILLHNILIYNHNFYPNNHDRYYKYKVQLCQQDHIHMNNNILFQNLVYMFYKDKYMDNIMNNYLYLPIINQYLLNNNQYNNLCNMYNHHNEILLCKYPNFNIQYMV